MILIYKESFLSIALSSNDFIEHSILLRKNLLLKVPSVTSYGIERIFLMDLEVQPDMSLGIPCQHTSLL